MKQNPENSSKKNLGSHILEVYTELKVGAGYWLEQFANYRENKNEANEVKRAKALQQKEQNRRDREWKKLNNQVRKKVRQLKSFAIIDLLNNGVLFDPVNGGNYLNPQIALLVEEKFAEFIDKDRNFLPGVVSILLDIYGAELRILSKNRE